MSRERMTGRLLDVWTENPSTTLTADAAAGTTTLQVDDVSPFNGADSDDGPGGTLQVGDQVVKYVDIDDDASTITLAASLPTAVTLASENYDVLVWNELYGQLDTVQYAMAQPEGTQDQADAIEAVVSDEVVDLADGDRGGPGESCELVLDGDEWELTKVWGRPADSRGVKFAQYTYIVTATGMQTFTLPDEPIENSEHLYWNGLYQPASEWSRAGRTITVPDADAFLRIGDELTVEYAYRTGLAAPSNILVDWQSPGWTYMFSTLSVDVDRSAVTYNDSSWSTGPAAFGNAPAHPSNYPADQKSGWPDKSTTWTVTPTGSTDDHRIWLRRHITCTADMSITVRARIDNAVTIYWNGTQIGSGANNDFTPIEVSVPGGLLVAGDNVLAVRGEDYGTDNYLDVQVTREGA